MGNHRRHIIIWKILRPILMPWLRWKFNFLAEPVGIEGPYLVFANHNTNWDPLLLACSFSQQMYYVASEHIFRWRFMARIIRWLVDPIARLKSRTATDTVINIMRRLRKGANVCLFAEGNRSWNGVTGPILPSTGKLARSSGVTLVTYRLEGGYFTSPRWSSALRRGRMRGRVAGVYTHEQLKAMSVEEVNRLINQDLFEDAWERQNKECVPYRGRDLAQHLETLLCLCPRCGRIGTLKSEGDRFLCDCGLSLRYNEYGFFEGENVPFQSVYEWDAWQTKRLFALWHGADEEPLFTDTEIRLREVLPEHRSRDLGVGELRLYLDRMECCGMVFPLSGIGAINLVQTQIVIMSFGQQNFEISSKAVRCMKKYQTIFDFFRPDAKKAV